MLELATTVTLTGPALPDFYVQHELENKLKGVLPTVTAAKELWPPVRRSLREPLTEVSGHIRVRNIVLEPLAAVMGYTEPAPAGKVRTREGDEDGGMIYRSVDGHTLRAWSYAYNTDLDAPIQRGFTSRYTPQRIAERVLLTVGERVGLLTNGVELRLIISEAARVPSTVTVDLNALKQYDAKTSPDALRLLIALASPEGIKRLEDILDDARLKQSKVTGELRKQARAAVEGFAQGILDHPANQVQLQDLLHQIMFEQGCDEADAKAALAKQLWRESLIVVYRLLFILSGEAGTRERPPFSFSSSSIWRNTYSPSAALGRIAQRALETGGDTGRFIEDGLRALFRFFEDGIRTTELTISPLGGALFGSSAAPLVDSLAWGEHGCAILLDKLLRAPRGKGKGRTLVRLSYRDLDVEELGRVYEALLELEPGITSERMVRLRRQKLEVVVPYEQGEKYRAAVPNDDDEEEVEDEPEEAEEEDGKKGKIKWIEAIPGPDDAHPFGRFYLRVGLGRKASGSFYTPESFVKFLVQETLGPQCDERSPKDDPQPRAILELNVLDPAMGSGHFLVGACRFLGERLYEACRQAAEKGLWERIPPEVAPYLPGRVLEGESTAGLSADRARAICKRLVAVNCLYGVDKNPLAVELAKVALWLESFAEGLPLTFLDHRLLCGDSLLGPINITQGGHDSPLLPPYATTPMDMILAQRVRAQLRERLADALAIIAELDSTIGLDPDDIAHKQAVLQRLHDALRPFDELCKAWSGGVMLGAEQVDTDAYNRALALLAEGEWDEAALPPNVQKLLAKGRDARVLTYPLAFPEVFFPDGDPAQMHGFDAVIGNPPWDRLLPAAKEFFAGYNIRVLDAPTKREREGLEKELLQDPRIAEAYHAYIGEFRSIEAIVDLLYEYQVAIVDGQRTIGKLDAYRVFMERNYQVLRDGGVTGIVIPSAFHANEGATGIRQLYLYHMALACCYSFENRRKLFEIDSRFKFANVVARKSEAGTQAFRCRFYLHDDEWLFQQVGALTYTREFVEATGGAYLSFIELQSPEDLAIAETCFSNAVPFGEYCDQHGIQFGRQLNMTDDAWRFTPVRDVLPNGEDPRDPKVTRWLLEQGYLVLHEGKTFWHYTDLWADVPNYLAEIRKLSDKPDWLDEARYFHFAYRAIASSTNERTIVFHILPPGVVAGNSAPIERLSKQRPNCLSLIVVAIANTFAFDWSARVRVSANINQFILNSTPVPAVDEVGGFLAHSALRLTCNHAGYAPLWQEQLGNAWREPKPKHTWPVLATEEERWNVRAAIDAVVAQAYGLNRDQYEHVLHSFDRASGPNPYTGLCLEKWDELHRIGLDAFTRKYDPYHDIPLVETLPKPVIDLKLPGEQDVAEPGADVPRDLFGDPLPTNLFGEVIHPDTKKKRR